MYYYSAAGWLVTMPVAPLGMDGIATTARRYTNNECSPGPSHRARHIRTAHRRSVCPLRLQS